MTNEDASIKKYRELGGIKFSLLFRIEIYVDHSSLTQGVGNVNLVLELGLLDGEDTRKLLLNFQGVKNLRLTPSENSIIHFPQLNITNISDSQWESLNYRIDELEEGALSFLCSTFEATVLP